WSKAAKEAEEVLALFDSVYGKLEMETYRREREVLSAKLDSIMLTLALKRTMMHYYQRSWQAMRLAAEAGLAIEPRDRRLLDLVSKLNTISATKSLADRIARR
ncbi:MAG: hypothetical protein KDB07_01940, partial [Planctomycetes bacterium]|nr:hypothetical protein [Planctomycetota bacterium]